MSPKAIVLIALALILTAILWIPAIVFAASGAPEKFQYYVQALEYLLRGLIEYFRHVIELFRAAVSS